MRQNFGVDLPKVEFPKVTYPGDTAPIVVKSHLSGRVACGLARFGLIPSWAKDNKIGRHTYNARSETIATKPSYRSPWRLRQYGIALVDNFYEPCYETGKAVKWCVGVRSGGPFGIACIWDRWTDPATGEVIASFSMLTVNADEHPVMKRFHRAGEEKRTPIILSPEQHLKWLDASLAEQASTAMTWSQMPALVATSV